MKHWKECIVLQNCMWDITSHLHPFSHLFLPSSQHCLYFIKYGLGTSPLNVRQKHTCVGVCLCESSYDLHDALRWREEMNGLINRKAEQTRKSNNLPKRLKKGVWWYMRHREKRRREKDGGRGKDRWTRMESVDRDSGQKKARTLLKHDLGDSTAWGGKGGKNKGWWWGVKTDITDR